MRDDQIQPRWHLADLQRYFGVSRQSIYKWRVTGELDDVTHYDPLGRPYFHPDEIEAWARSRSSSEDVA